MGNGLSLSFKRMKESDLVTFTSVVIQKTTTDARYEFVKAEADALKTSYEAYIVAISNATLGGSDRSAIKKACYEQVIKLLTTIGRLVEIKADGDDSFIKDAGFDTRLTPSPIKSISTPFNLVVKNEDEDGAVRLSWKGAPEATTFGIEYRTGDDQPWKNGSYTAAHDFVFKNMPQGVRMECKVRGIGTNDMMSSWSAVGSVYVS
jgi:hypothetical protein